MGTEGKHAPAERGDAFVGVQGLQPLQQLAAWGSSELLFLDPPPTGPMAASSSASGASSSWWISAVRIGSRRCDCGQRR